MKIRKVVAAAAMLTAGALVVTGCSAGYESEVIEGTEIRVAWNAEFNNFNGDSAQGNATQNNNILYMVNSGFNYYNNTPELVSDENYGTIELVSDDPLTVKYTFNEGVKWSDGTPVDAADLLLQWAASSGHLNNIEPEYDDEGNITNQEEIDNGVFFDAAALGTKINLVSETPKIGDDGRSLTLVYDETFIDWETAIDTGVSAHGTVQLAYPDEDYTPEEAKDALVKAIQDEDYDWLSPVAKFWSSGYAYKDLPSDPKMYISAGPYVISDLKADEFVSVTANPEYNWGPSPRYEKITVRVIADPVAQVTALQNGEVDIAAGQPTADLISQLESAKGIKFAGSVEGTYEHVDLQVTNGGAFDPKSAPYNGDAEASKKARMAFLKTIPRGEILEKLIKPLQEDAELRNSLIFVPGTAGYEASVANSSAADFDEVDIEGAKALLADAGFTAAAPLSVRFLYGEGNTRREQEFELIRQSAALAGITVVDGASITWGADLDGNKASYDAALFGWQSTSLAVSESAANFVSDGGNNFYGYSNAEVDSLFDKLAGEIDPDAQQKILVDVEKVLYDDPFSVAIFQFPGVTAWSDKITGVEPSPLAPTYFWNFWEWAPANAK